MYLNRAEWKRSGKRVNAPFRWHVPLTESTETPGRSDPVIKAEDHLKSLEATAVKNPESSELRPSEAAKERSVSQTGVFAVSGLLMVRTVREPHIRGWSRSAQNWYYFDQRSRRSTPFRPTDASVSFRSHSSLRSIQFVLNNKCLNVYV